MASRSTSTKSETINEECEEESYAHEKIFTKVWPTDPPQKYIGESLHDNLHGHGFYFVEEKDKFFYDGLFYANKLEGYSQIFYGDGSHYQGLFKDNRRFGPGVFTYPNGDQDVGLWNGFSLVALVTELEGKIVPKLAHTAAGKLKLLKYRNLVPVCPEKQDIALDTLISLGAREKVLNESHKLYNLDVENKNNAFFNRKLYDEAFHHNQDCVIDILLPDVESSESSNCNDEESREDEGIIDTSAQDLKRIRQLSDRLNIINNKLAETKRIKANVSAKVDYCRKCCIMDEIEEADYGFHTTVQDVANFSRMVGQQSGDVQSVRQYSQADAKDDVVSTAGLSYYSFLYYSSVNVADDPAATGVVVEQEQDSTCISISDYLCDICVCDENMKIDDLNMLEEKLEEVTKDEVYYENIKTNLREKLRAHVRKTQEPTSVKTKKVLVNDLLAWNNEELSMAMMKHSFLHRRKEYMVIFDVSNLLIGNRSEFANEGVHERKCIEFLMSCCNGEVHLLVEIMRQHGIHVNMCDADGNSGIFFAVANSRINMISLLVNFGAKLDQLNGEGLTPLCLCLLRYLALIMHVSDWEKSFLPSTTLPRDEREVRKWYPNKSLLSMSSHSEMDTAVDTFPTKQDKSVRKSFYQSEIKADENYVFDTSFPIYMEPKKKVISGKKPSLPEVVVPPENIKGDDEIKLLIQNTIESLLGCGADPNFGEVPLCPLLLSVFTQNATIVMLLLEAHADPNIVNDEELTALHIIATLKCTSENLTIAHVLLNYFCDPNLKCSPNHWPEQKVRLVGKNVNLEDYVDYGKNPLHLLCLRRDFPLDDCNYFVELAGVLIKHHIRVNEMYLGHTPLSIAVLTGNKSLVEMLLNLDFIDPYLSLKYDMGNILTLFILKRYEDVLPVETCKEMMKLLIDASVNPLKSVGQFENAIEFMDKEHEIVTVAKDKKGGKGSKGSKSAKKDKPKKGNKGSQKGKSNSQHILKEYLKELARDTIIKYVQMEAVDNLYNLVEENMLEYDFVKVLAEFLTPSIAIENIEALFSYGRIKAVRFDRNICLQLIEFVDKYKKVVKAKKEKRGRSPKGGSSKGSKKSKKGKGVSHQALSEPEATTADKIDAINITFNRHKGARIKPGLDSRTKYQVCFHCLRKRNKALMQCPRCQLIYFCSEQCNKLNIKMKTQHVCNVNFYKDERTRWESGVVDDQLLTLEHICMEAIERCGERVRTRLEEERQMRSKQLEAERKMDIYGTKFLKKKNLERTDFYSKRLTIMSLDGSKFGTDIWKNSMESSCLKRRLTNLSIIDDNYSTFLLHRHESSLKQYKALPTSAKRPLANLKPNIECCEYEGAGVEEKDVTIKLKSSSVRKRATKKKESRKSNKEEVVSKFEAIEALPERNPIVRKLRKIPKKYKYFIEMLSNYFPKQDLPFLFLPYACYSNGHLYYKLDEDIFSRTYSMV